MGQSEGRLYYAVVLGDLNTVRSELRLGDVDLSLRIDKKPFLHQAGDRGFKQIASLLIQYGLDPNQTYGKQQRSLLRFAATTFNFGFASVLLEHHADPNAQTTSGETLNRTGQSLRHHRSISFNQIVNQDHQFFKLD